VPHGSPSAGKIPAELKDQQGYWISILLYVLARHQHHAGQQRTGTQDLSGPARSALARQDGLDPGSIAGALGLSAQRCEHGRRARHGLSQALSAQRIVNIEASSRAILDQVIAGEYPIGLMMSTILRLQ